MLTSWRCSTHRQTQAEPLPGVDAARASAYDACAITADRRSQRAFGVGLAAGCESRSVALNRRAWICRYPEQSPGVGRSDADETDEIMPTPHPRRIGIFVATIAMVGFTAVCLSRFPLGAATAPVASLRIRPAPVKFPTTPPPYSPMPIVKVTITNNGQAKVRSIAVHPISVYSVPSNSCTTLAPGHHCVASIQFCPTSPGHYVDALVVTGKNARTGARVRASVTLNGTAT